MLICLVVPHLGGGCVRRGRVLDQYSRVWQYPQFYCHVWDKQQNPHCLVLKPFIVWQNYCRRSNLCYSHWFTFENLEQISSSKSNQSCTACNTLFITEDRPAQNYIPCLGQIFAKQYTLFETEDKNHRCIDHPGPQTTSAEILKVYPLRGVKWFLEKAGSWKILAHSLILEALFMGL